MGGVVGEEWVGSVKESERGVAERREIKRYWEDEVMLEI
jgi:hypothetical protein